MNDSKQLQRIDTIDNLVEENTHKIKALQRENDRLMIERREVFHTIKKECPVKYQWGDAKMIVEIYIDFDSRKNILYRGLVTKEFPDKYEMLNVSEEYQNDFRMIWNQAYRECEDEKRRGEEEEKRLLDQIRNNLEKPQMIVLPEEARPCLKKIFNAALKVYHEDNNIKSQEVIDTFSEKELKEYLDRIEESNGMTTLINELKELCGV
ncbi:MAG: hypothetical protein LUH07_01740 [Lachnospiraceae bacterium]|nr:hypothetical protein [Lachnospiraceae bacterium]